MEVTKETAEEIVFEKSPVDIIIKLITLVVILIITIWIYVLSEDRSNYFSIGFIIILFSLLLVWTFVKADDKILIHRLDQNIKRNKKVIANFDDIDLISIEKYFDEDNFEECYDLQIVFKNKPSLELASDCDIKIYDVGQRIATITKRELRVTKKHPV